MSFFIYKPNLEATIFDGKHEPVTLLGGAGALPDEVSLAYFRDTFNQEFGPGYSCEVERVFSDGSREAVADWQH